MPERGYCFPETSDGKHFRIDVNTAGVNLVKLRLPSFEWHTVSDEGYHPGFFGNFRYAKRINLIREGLERVANDGLLHVLTVGHMQSVSETLEWEGQSWQQGLWQIRSSGH